MYPESGNKVERETETWFHSTKKRANKPHEERTVTQGSFVGLRAGVGIKLPGSKKKKTRPMPSDSADSK